MSNTRTKLSKEEFVARFKAHMISHAGFEKFDDGGPVAEYADETAPTYWEEQHQNGESPEDGESPEECAESDMSYWGED